MMTTTSEALHRYECIGHVSQFMLCAARQNDWDALLEGERCCAALIERVQAERDHDLERDAQFRERKFAILRRILTDDAEIRNLTQPWLRQLDRCLGRTPWGRMTGSPRRSPE